MVLEGKTIYLREERISDIETFVKLRNDMATQAWNKALPPDYTLPMYQKRFEEKEFSFDRKDARFTIIHKESDELVGTISYSEYESRFSTTIGLVVRKKFWGTGASFDAQEVLLKFLFEELGLLVARIWTQSGNPRAIRLAEKSGFRVSARVRESIFIHGKIFDTLIMDLLREEYYSLHPELLDGLPPI